MEDYKAKVEKYLDNLIYELQDDVILNEVDKGRRKSYTVSSCFFEYVVNNILEIANERAKDTYGILHVPEMYKKDFKNYIELSLAGSWTFLMGIHLPGEDFEVFKKEKEELSDKKILTHKEKHQMDLENSYDLLFELSNNFQSNGRYTFSMRERTLVIKNPTEFNDYEIKNWITLLESNGSINNLGGSLALALKISLKRKEWERRIEKVKDSKAYEGDRELQILEDHLISDSLEIELKSGRGYILNFVKSYFRHSVNNLSNDALDKKEMQELKDTEEKGNLLIEELDKVEEYEGNVSDFLDMVIYDEEDEVILEEIQKYSSNEYNIGSLFFKNVLDKLVALARKKEDDEYNCCIGILYEVPSKYKRSFHSYYLNYLSNSWDYLMKQHLEPELLRAYRDDIQRPMEKVIAEKKVKRVKKPANKDYLNILI